MCHPVHPFEDCATSCRPSVRQSTIVGMEQLLGPFLPPRPLRNAEQVPCGSWDSAQEAAGLEPI